MDVQAVYIFLGKFYPPQMLKTLQDDSKGKIGFSNHNFEMSLIHGFSSHNISMRILTVPAVFSWPHNNSRVFTKSEVYSVQNINVKSAGFCNIAGINFFSTALSTLYNLVSLYRKTEKEIHIITNAPTTPVLIGLFLSKRITRKKIKITVIIPDVPSMITMMHRSKQTLKGRLVDIINSISIKMLGKCDKHVLLTDAMTDFFKKPVRHIVMEGLINVENCPLVSIYPNEGRQVILYTGSIHQQFGIMNLVEAFESAKLPNNVELWICGSGDAEKELEKKAATDSRIKYWGLVDSQRAREMQQQATILVNPRTSVHAFTKYSFPSKTLEYMLTGRPVVMNRLPGVPEEYYNYVITPLDESIEQLALTLEKVMSMTGEERQNKGAAGRDYVLKNKNSVIQTQRILDFVNEI